MQRVVVSIATKASLDEFRQPVHNLNDWAAYGQNFFLFHSKLTRFKYILGP